MGVSRDFAMSHMGGGRDVRRRHSQRCGSAACRGSVAFPALALSCCSVAAGQQDKIFGLCYGPFPAKELVRAAEIIDDFMAESAKPLWGHTGRGDLQLIRKLGANTVRTYGNDPQYNHLGFLDEAQRVGLGVVPGLSDFPYTQAKDQCKLNGFDCYANIKATYLNSLKSGFMKDGAYHPAIRHLVVINEPDLKTMDKQGLDPKMFSKLIVSAIDGVLDAEKEAGITGPLIQLTATFSFAECLRCPKDQAGLLYPALSQMIELRNAFDHPEWYGYKPKNDLRAFYEKRFINSFNTQNPVGDLQAKFFTPYQLYFPFKGVTIEEFHSWQPPVDQLSQVQALVAMTRTMPQLLGFQFFEFQVRYDKETVEQNFGMFGLGDYKITDLFFFGHMYNVWCLKMQTNPFNGAFLPEEFSAGVGAEGVGQVDFCRPDASKASLNQEGFAAVEGLKSVDDMKIFVTRVAEHLGYDVDTGSQGLRDFSQNVHSFDALRTALIGETHSWAQLDMDAACVADRLSNQAVIGQATDEACKSTSFNCKNIPLECKGSTWDTADYVFSTYFNLKRAALESADPITTCNLNGAARYATASYYNQYDKGCIVNKDPARTPLTDEGFQAILVQKDKQKMAQFISRYIRHNYGGAQVGDKKALEEFADNPPTSMYDVYHLLKLAQWVCGGNTNRVCRVTSHTELWWWQFGFAAVGLTIFLASCISWIWVHKEAACIKAERELTNFLHCRACRKLHEDPDNDLSSEFSS